MPLNRDSLMPFGKYKGTALRSVPAAWLIWAHRNLKDDRHNSDIAQVKEYIKANYQEIYDEYLHEKGSKFRRF